MATTPKPVAVADEYADATASADALLTDIGRSVVSITDGVKKLAAVVVAVRSSIKKNVTSKSTKKLVKDVPDWTGRSPEYREWYNDVLLKLIEKHIPDEYQSTIRTRLQNQVQELAHKSATPAQKKHLGMAAKSKAQTQQAKRTAKKDEATRPSEESFSVDTFTDYVTSSKPEEAAQAIAAMLEAFSARASAAGFTPSKAEAQRTSKLIGQALQYGMSVKSRLDALAAPKSGVKVEA